MMTDAGLSDEVKAATEAKFTRLTEMGLPEEQAIKSIKADLEYKGPPETKPATCFCVLPFNNNLEAADLEKLKAGLTAYGTNAKASKGKIHAAYTIDEEAKCVKFFEVFDGMQAMDAHIGNCFPDYAGLIALCTMKTMHVTCDEKDLEAWKASTGVWVAGVEGGSCTVTAAVV